MYIWCSNKSLPIAPNIIYKINNNDDNDNDNAQSSIVCFTYITVLCIQVRFWLVAKEHEIPVVKHGLVDSGHHKWAEFIR